MLPRPIAASLVALVAVLIAAAAQPACAAPTAARNSDPGRRVTWDAGVPVLVGSVIRVIDGDTLMVQLASGPITVRLASIDAPEHDQPGGLEAQSALVRRLQGRQVEVEVETQDQYERLVAYVYLGGENINSWLVQQGYAWAYRQYLRDARYCAWEADARQSRRGLWGAPAGSQRAPWEWRRAQREGGAFRFTVYGRETASSCAKAMRRGTESMAVSSPPPAPQPVDVPAVESAPAPANCRIKGNISESGKIYHVPGSDAYERTQIDTRKGERWFCTQAEAEAAGWRALR